MLQVWRRPQPKGVPPERLKKELEHRTKEVQRHQHAKNTNYVYNTGVLAYLNLVAFLAVLPLPVEDEILAQFVVFQSATCAYGTLKVYLYGVRAWALNRGFHFKPWYERHCVFSAMQGLKRLFGAEQSKKLAVSPELLLIMLGLMDFDDFNCVMLRAAMLTAFFGMFRKDNISVEKASAFNPRANLTRGDFIIKGTKVWVRVGHSKTNQFGRRFHWIPLVEIPGSKMCPVAAVRAALALYPELPGDAPMFLWKAAGSAEAKPMTHSNFVKAFKLYVKKAGLDWKSYSGHSFRRGGATFAFNLGVRPELIQYLGDWASEAYKRYQEMSPETRLELPQVMSEAIASDPLYL